MPRDLPPSLRLAVEITAFTAKITGSATPRGLYRIRQSKSAAAMVKGVTMSMADTQARQRSQTRGQRVSHTHEAERVGRRFGL